MYVSYAELVTEAGRKWRFNTSIVIVDCNGEIIGKYRKVHLPRSCRASARASHQHLEKRYFEPRNLGFGV